MTERIEGTRTKPAVLDWRFGEMSLCNSVDEAWAEALCRYPNATTTPRGEKSEGNTLILVPDGDGVSSLVGMIWTNPPENEPEGTSLEDWFALFKDAEPAPTRKPTDGTLFGD